MAKTGLQELDLPFCLKQPKGKKAKYVKWCFQGTGHQTVKDSATRDMRNRWGVSSVSRVISQSPGVARGGGEKQGGLPEQFL